MHLTRLNRKQTALVKRDLLWAFAATINRLFPTRGSVLRAVPQAFIIAHLEEPVVALMRKAPPASG